jgi:hypothetical protein
MEESEVFVRLKERLLAIGGGGVFSGSDQELPRHLLERGRLFDGEPVHMPGDDNECHRNTALRYLADPHNLKVVTGYALSDKTGLWVEHSWLTDEAGLVYETTEDNDHYFGAELSDFEAFGFVMAELISHLPGFEEMRGALEEDDEGEVE